MADDITALFGLPRASARRSARHRRRRTLRLPAGGDRPRHTGLHIGAGGIATVDLSAFSPADATAVALTLES